MIKRTLYSLPVLGMLLVWAVISWLIFDAAWDDPQALIYLPFEGLLLLTAFAVHRRLSVFERHLAASVCTTALLFVAFVGVVKVFGQTVEPKYTCEGMGEVHSDVVF